MDYEKEDVFVEVRWKIDDVRMMQDAIIFYRDNKPTHGDPSTKKGPQYFTGHCNHILGMFDRMVMEYTFHTKEADKRNRINE